jgi:hypothetical protein
MEIEVVGTCDGFAIERDNVSISARDDTNCPGATIVGRITVDDARRVSLHCLAVTSVENGIDILRGASALVEDNLISGAAAGVQIAQGSSARVFNNEILDSTSVGIFVNGGSYGEVRDNVLASSSIGNFSQIFVTGSSAADVFDNTITASGGTGVDAGFASSIEAGGNNVSGTAYAGIRVAQNAHMFLRSANTVDNPALGGQSIFCGSTGSLRLDAIQTIISGSIILDSGCEITNYSGAPFPP